MNDDALTLMQDRIARINELRAMAAALEATFTALEKPSEAKHENHLVLVSDGTNQAP